MLTVITCGWWAVADLCGCGRPLITFAGDLTPTCPECHGLPDSCDCPKLRAGKSPAGRHRASPAPAQAASDPLAEELPAPTNPMAVARIVIEDHQDQGHLTLHRWRGSWMQWQRTHWAEAEDAAVRSTLYTRLEHAVYTDTSGKSPVKRQWEPNRRKVGDLEDALAASVALAGSTDPPAWIGGNGPVPAGEVVACGNGLLHVTTRAMLGHTPRFFGTVAVPFDYDPAARRPAKWLEFLAEIWPDDPDSVDALQEWFGYVLSGRTDLHKILMLIGPTRSGKGTIARVLTALLGSGNAAAPTLASLGTNFGLQPLLGKPLALVSDARLGGNENEVVERLLSISGEDTLTVDRKYREPWTGKLPARFMILSNELPRFGDASGAIANRFVVLVMHKSFLGAENTALTGELLAELPGILSWALDGLDRLVRSGRLTSPKSSEDAISALCDLVSPVSAFVRDWCETGAGEIRVSALFDAWKSWAEANNHRPGNSATFGRNLRAVVPAIRMSQPRAEGSRERVYVGITLNADGFGEERVPARASEEGYERSDGLDGTEDGVARVPARVGTGKVSDAETGADQGFASLARDGTGKKPKTGLTREAERSPISNKGETRVPARASAFQADSPLCADPACRQPLDAALVAAGISAHPTCHGPAEPS